MATFKLVGPLAALLLSWFVASAYCVTALAGLPATLQRVGSHAPERPAPALAIPPPPIA